MNQQDFFNLIRNKSIKALLHLLKLGQSGERKIDPDLLQLVIQELKLRTLSLAEQQELDKILSLVDSQYTRNSNTNDEFTKQELEQIIHLNFNTQKSDKYGDLETIANIIAIIGYGLVFFGLAAFFYFFVQEKISFGLSMIINSFVASLFTLAFSKLIYVFIAIEFNTRQS